MMRLVLVFIVFLWSTMAFGYGNNSDVLVNFDKDFDEIIYNNIELTDVDYDRLILNDKYKEKYPALKNVLFNYSIAGQLLRNNIVILLPFNTPKYEALCMHVLQGMFMGLEESGSPLFNFVLINLDDNSQIQSIADTIKKVNPVAIVGPLFTYQTKVISEELKKKKVNIKLISLTNDSKLVDENVIIFGMQIDSQVTSFIDYTYQNNKSSLSLVLPNNSIGLDFFNSIKKEIANISRRDAQLATSSEEKMAALYNPYIMKSEFYNAGTFRRSLFKINSEMSKTFISDLEKNLYSEEEIPEDIEAFQVTKKTGAIFYLPQKNLIDRFLNYFKSTDADIFLESNIDVALANNDLIINSSVPFKFFSIGYYNFIDFADSYNEKFSHLESLPRIAGLSYDIGHIITLLENTNNADASLKDNVFQTRHSTFRVSSGVADRMYNLYEYNNFDIIKVDLPVDERFKIAPPETEDESISALQEMIRAIYN